MSSILDALRKLEAAEAPSAGGPVVVRERPRAIGVTAAVIAVAFGAGAGLMFFLRAERAAAPTPEHAPSPVHAAVATPEPAAPVVRAAAIEPAIPQAPPAAGAAATLALAAPAAPLPQAAVDVEPPRARIATVTPPAPAEPAPAMRRPEPPAVAPRAEPPASAATPEADGASAPIDVLPRLPTGAPHVQVSFLLYSPNAERRSVMLNLDGGDMATLHEGERAGDIEIARILPDRVHVRWGGRLFSVRARE